MGQLTSLMQIMQGAARKAGRALNRDFGEIEHLQVSRKGPADFVTAADRRSEEVIFKELSEKRPGYGFLMEERGEVAGTDKTHRWIVDPLDGTLNFMHGQPHFAVSIALERMGEIVAGVVYNPAVDEMFHAEKGTGAWLNDRRLRVAARKELADAVIATGTPFYGKKGHARFLKELHQVMGATAGIRRYGSASLDLSWVAAGRFDGFWERDLKAWDIAAGLVIVREAGGFIAEIDGGEDVLSTGNIVAGNEDMLARLIEKLDAAR
ncbi:inositol monophosphatase family protein [Hyphobacterium marinum]|uniref:Inositol-1-monophosphatase n=1 Tax=Hyphobacterium marinum TaxID=3116574 RepID=A0ABU7LZE1_9PROT|nr:inositol monophosphatase family protein [Hyphobacterium sp. Y6023]MEE2566560.1 inositol monophosphatase family protein [Hyphobacterium sp. Y6023]